MGAGLPDRFALVPTRYLHIESRPSVHLFAGTRTARLRLPASTLSEILGSASGATIVSAPGQNFSASALPALPSFTIFSASFMLAASTGRGLSSCLPFIANIRATEESLYGSHPIP